MIAALICSAPEFCSALAALISWTSSAVRLISGIRAAMVWPASSAIDTLSEESLLISPASFWLRSASFPTSDATTANPFPYSPARAASIEALRASMFVERAISSMIPILLAISRIAFTVARTAFPPASAACADLRAIFSVCSALSAFCLMFPVICSIEEDISSTEAACSVAPWDISCEVLLSSWLPAET